MTTEKTRQIATNVAKFAVATSAGTTVTAVLKNVLPIATKGSQRLQFAVGVFAISGMVASKVGNWTGSEIGDLFEAIDEFKSRNDEPTVEE